MKLLHTRLSTPVTVARPGATATAGIWCWGNFGTVHLGGGDLAPLRPGETINPNVQQLFTLADSDIAEGYYVCFVSFNVVGSAPTGTGFYLTYTGAFSDAPVGYNPSPYAPVWYPLDGGVDLIEMPFTVVIPMYVDTDPAVGTIVGNLDSLATGGLTLTNMQFVITGPYLFNTWFIGGS